MSPPFVHDQYCRPFAFEAAVFCQVPFEDRAPDRYSTSRAVTFAQAEEESRVIATEAASQKRVFIEVLL